MMPKRIEPYEYPAHYLMRRVSRAGTIRVRQADICQQHAAGGLSGLEEVDDGVYDLYWCFCQIGRYELKTNKIHDVVSRVGLSRRQADLASRVLDMSLEFSVTQVSGLYALARLTTGWSTLRVEPDRQLAAVRWPQLLSTDKDAFS